LLPYVLDFYVDGATSRMAELARACGLGPSGENPASEDPRSLALSLVAAIRSLNASVGIPPTIEQIADADIPEIVQRALAEAHGTYPVPMYMSAADCATIVQRAAGRVMVATTDHPAPAVAASPQKKEI
jgi:alcohol dehydrogenase class IV